MSKRGFKVNTAKPITDKPSPSTVSSAKNPKQAAKLGDKTFSKYPLKDYDRAFVYTSTWKLIKPGYMLFRKHRVTACVIYILPPLLAVLANAVIAVPSVRLIWLILGSLLLQLLVVWTLLNTATTVYFQLRVIAGGKRPGIWECYRRSIRYIPRLIGLTIMVTLAILFGLLLLLVPGFKAIRRYSLASYFLVDGDTGIREAMRRSAIASDDAKGYVWSTLIALSVVGLLGWLLYSASPSYGLSTLAVLSGLYVFIPALRYKEIALHKSALAIED